MDKPRWYAVYPQPLRSPAEVEKFTRRSEALDRASERARGGENVQVDLSDDNFVSFKTIARINAVPTEDLL